MRTISSTVFQQQFGLEPIMVVGIKLASWLYYSDRDPLPGEQGLPFQGRITEIQDLDNVVNISNNSSSASVTIQLIDVDGALKQLYNSTDLHMKPLKIYQYFAESNFETDKILLFDGCIASPVIYDEAQMTLTITGLSKLKNTEVGFSIDNAVWRDIIPNEIEPEPWPMPFGSNENYPLTLISIEPRGKLIHGFGIPDFTSPITGYVMHEYINGIAYRVKDFDQQAKIIPILYDWWSNKIRQLERRLFERSEWLKEFMVNLQDANTLNQEQQQDEANALAANATRREVKAVATRYRDRAHRILEDAIWLMKGALPTYTHPDTYMQRLQQTFEYTQKVFNEKNKEIQQEIQELQQAKQKYAELKAKILAEAARIDAENKRAKEMLEAERHSYEQQLLYEIIDEEIPIYDGMCFPFDRQVWLKVGPALIFGKFQHVEIKPTGVSNFLVEKVIHPKTCDFHNEFCTELESERFQVLPHIVYGQYISLDAGVHEAWKDLIPGDTLPIDITSAPGSWLPDAEPDNFPEDQQMSLSEWCAKVGAPAPGSAEWYLNYMDHANMLKEEPEEGPKKKRRPFNFKDWTARFIGDIKGDRAGFVWVPAGDPVRLAFSNPIEFVISIIPCDLENIVISAYRTYANQRRLTPIPEEWYEIKIRNYGDGLIASILILQRPLDTLANMGFEPQIYATVRSAIGPNVVDVIQYLITQYLPDKTCDAESFSQARAKTAKTPVNFVLRDRPKILELLSDICYQACLAIWYYDDTVFLRYLPDAPADPLGIDITDIDTGSLRLHYTTTEDIVTKTIAVYRTSQNLEEPHRLAARYNTDKYGVNEATVNYFIYDNRDAVVRSVTFWLIRQANTWKYLEFTTALSTLIFDTMDAVLINLENNFIANGPVIGLIEQVEYNSKDFTLKYRVWLPVRAGEMETYTFAYYNLGDVTDEFPEPEDWVTGNGIGSPRIRQLERGDTGDTIQPGVKVNWPEPDRLPIEREPKRPRIIDPVKKISPPTTASGQPKIIEPGPYPKIYHPTDLSTVDIPVDEPPILPEKEALADLLTLSLQRTLIYDNRTGQSTPLGAFFAGVNEKGALVIRQKLTIRNDTDGSEGIFEMLPVPGVNQFAAKLAYLAEDDYGGDSNDDDY